MYSTLLGVALVTFMMPLRPQTSVAYQVTPPDVLNLRGVVRDFSSTHPDFGITNAAVMGHYVGTVAPILGPDRHPASTGTGVQVTTEWSDQSSNPILPYVQATDPGLPGGHFDVDVYDGPTTGELYHEHQFDDTSTSPISMSSMTPYWSSMPSSARVTRTRFAWSSTTFTMAEEGRSNSMRMGRP